MKSCCLREEDAQVSNNWRRKIKGESDTECGRSDSVYIFRAFCVHNLWPIAVVL